MSSFNINSVFFDGAYKLAWKSLMPVGLTEAEVDFINEVALYNSKGKVLDIMCGYGRHAIELARRGVAVTAIDNQIEYINEIREISRREKIPVNAIHIDVTKAALQDQYHAAICMGNSFSFFNKTDAMGILENISNHLVPKGIFIINSWMIAEIAIKHFRPRDWHSAGEYKCILDYEYKFEPSRIESEQTIISPKGEIEILKGVDYIFAIDELEDMFNRVGMRLKHLYSTPKKRKFTFGDGTIYIVAEKNT
jgi:SAM-dependent methyltransferase